MSPFKLCQASSKLVFLCLATFLILNGFAYFYLGRPDLRLFLVNVMNYTASGTARKLDQGEQLDETVVHVALSSCGSRIEEASVSIKSAVLLSTSSLRFHIFTETHSRQKFTLLFHQLKQPGKEFSYELHDTCYPSTGNVSSSNWKTMFRPCASQRLFLHICMPNVDAVLYVDTDTLFTAPLKRTWDLFRNFNSTHIVGMVEEQLGNAQSFYDLPGTIPHYGTKGLNSGVLLMNLTRIRAKPWERELVKYLSQYKRQIQLGDQDLLNIYFLFHQGELFICPCGTNYRPGFCRYDNCKQLPLILHGNNFAWRHKDEPAAVYNAFRSHDIRSPVQELAIALCKNLKNAAKTSCRATFSMLVEEIVRHVKPNIRLNQTSCIIKES